MRRPSRFSLVVVLAAMLVLHEPARHVVLSVLRFPFVVVRTGVATLLALPRLSTLSRENATLRETLIQQQLEATQLRESLRHLQQAQALAATTPALQGVLAVTIGRSLLPTQHYVLLDKGQRQGLTPDSVVVDAAGVVGRILELQPSSCLVMLLTDPESRIAGLVERSRETGLLVGMGRGHCEFVYLDIQSDIKEGDQILTAGLGGPFPKGLLLGTVVRVLRDESSGSSRAIVSPAAHLGRLEEVLCFSTPPAAGVQGKRGEVR
jgi:rod shape-determining protein MreC